MAKSLRSKWKKKCKAIKSQETAPYVAARVANLRNKLTLVAKGNIKGVAMQRGVKGHVHTAPTMDDTQPLKLEPLTTDAHKGIRGNPNNAEMGNHPQLRATVHREKGELPSGTAAAASAAVLAGRKLPAPQSAVPAMRLAMADDNEHAAMMQEALRAAMAGQGMSAFDVTPMGDDEDAGAEAEAQAEAAPEAAEEPGVFKLQTATEKRKAAGKKRVGGAKQSDAKRLVARKK